MDLHTHTHRISCKLHMSGHLRICMYVCIYIYIHVCIHTCTYVWMQLTISHIAVFRSKLHPNYTHTVRIFVYIHSYGSLSTCRCVWAAYGFIKSLSSRGPMPHTLFRQHSTVIIRKLFAYIIPADFASKEIIKTECCFRRIDIYTHTYIYVYMYIHVYIYVYIYI
jgi:hypothetical protein